MPRKSQTANASATATIDYWEDALKKLGLLSPITAEVTQYTASTAEIGAEELKVIRDPLFDVFLRFGPGKTGSGPKTVGEFLALPPQDKKFYIEVFRNWKAVIREKRLEGNIRELEKALARGEI